MYPPVLLPNPTFAARSCVPNCDCHSKRWTPWRRLARSNPHTRVMLISAPEKFCREFQLVASLWLSVDGRTSRRVVYAPMPPACDSRRCVAGPPLPLPRLVYLHF
jgi:hypothetical protein